MKQTTLTQSRAPGRVIGWTNFSHWRIVHEFCRHCQCFTGFAYIILLVFIGVEHLSRLDVTLSKNTIIFFFWSQVECRPLTDVVMHSNNMTDPYWWMYSKIVVTCELV